MPIRDYGAGRSRSGAAIVVAVIYGCLALPAFASHKVHSGAQRYGDVIIIRNADGSIESRDVGRPTRCDPDGAPIHHSAASHKSHPVATRHGVKTGVKIASNSNAKKTSTKSKQTVKASSSRHSSSRHTGSSGGGDVVIIRNADGSIEARDAQ